MERRNLEETKNILRNKNIAISSYIFDISDRDKVAQLPDKVLEAHKKIDIVINNAGLSVIGSVDEVDEDDWSYGTDILLNSVIQLTTAFLPYLRKRPESAIVNISSIFGLFSVPKQSIYNVGKFELNVYRIACFRMKMNDPSVEVYCVFPGHIGTNIYTSSRFKSLIQIRVFFGVGSTVEDAGMHLNNAPTSLTKQ